MISQISAHRSRRHYHHYHPRSSSKFLDDTLEEKKHIEVPISCEQKCEAQFEADYQTEFGSFYAELHWFPIHPLLTQSQQKFKSFCSFVYERNTCLHRCGGSEEPWTPFHHLCVEHQEEMIEILPCLRATSDMEHCSETCANSARRYSRFSNERSLDYISDEAENKLKDARSKGCFYQLCILECRSRLIEDHCSETEIDKTKHFLRRYYSSDAFHDALKSPPTPGICHQLISQDSERRVAENTKLAPLDEGMIQEMRSKLDAEVKRRSTKKN
ncbi:hypothetical protein FO519_004203 [Halicephalobus sp. NKZ332]|nr:hypothetical protein FO519_004203 [Halicephalobus sp. NKZ332]